MAKKRTINELRQTKDTVYTNPGAAKWNVEGHKKYLEEKESKEAELMLEQKELQNVYGKWANTGIMSKEGKEYLDIAGDKDLIEAAKEQIISKLKDHFYDIIFQAVCDEMDQNYMFRQNNYLTEAGEELFEDAWYEWYHNHHGDILMAVLKDMGQ